MKHCDLATGAAKLELALKSLRTNLVAVEGRWNDAASRTFHEKYLADVDPKTHGMFEAIGRMTEVLAAAERDLSDEGEL